MPLHQRQPYVAGGRFMAGRQFMMSGVNYNFGDPVDVSGIEPRRVRQMFDCRMLELDTRSSEPAAKAPEPREKPAKPKATPEPKAEVNKAPDTPGEPHIKHRGFGNFVVVDRAGEVVAGPMPKDQAEVELRKYL